MTTSDGLWRFPVTYEGLPQEQPFSLDTTGDSLANDIVLMETPNELKLTVTMQQYTELLSAALNGANRFWGERYIEVIYPLIKAGKEFAMSCEGVADCVETSEAVQTAINNVLNELGYRPEAGTPESPTIYDDNPLLIDGSLIEDCENDNLFGAITQLVDFINKRLVDLFEILESETNIVERSQIIAEAFPISDSIGIDSAAAAFDQAVEEVSEGYDAAFTEELEDEYRCDLFCLVKDTCELDFQTFADYFNGRIANTPPADQFSEYIEWFVTGDFTGTNIVDAAYSVVMSALAYGSDALGVNIRRLMQSMVSALNDPNSDWETLCEDCDPEPTSHPEIGIDDCAGFAPAMGILTWQHDDVWHLASQANGSTDQRAMVVREGGGNFRLMTVTAISGSVPAFRVWKQAGGACSAGFGAPNPATVDLEMYGFTAAIGSPFTLEIQFVDV